MDCRKNYSDQIISDIKDIIGVGRTSAIENPNKVLEILLPVRGIQGERLYTREETYEWAKKVQKQVNSRYRASAYGNLIDIDSTPANGTKITINVPTKLVDYYVNRDNGDVSFSPKIKKVGKYNAEVLKLKDRIRTLERNLASNKSDRARSADLSAKIDMLKNRAEQLENEDRLIDVVAYGNSDMREVEEILKKDSITISELLYVNKLIHQWESLDLKDFFNKFELKKTEDDKFSANVQSIQNITSAANVNRSLYTEVFENTVKELFKQQGIEATAEEIFGAKIEIGGLQRFMRDISTTNDIIFQMTSKMIKDANTNTEQEVLDIVKEVDRLSEAVEKDPLFKKEGWSLFSQIIDGVKTGRLASRFSQKFYDTKKTLRVLAQKTKDKAAWENYFKWKRDNEILFDLRKLFNKDYEELDGSTKYDESEIDAHRADLKKQLGDKGYKEYHNRLADKMDLYKKDYIANKERIENLEGDSVVKDAMLQEWVLANSPFVYADQVYDGKKQKFGDSFVPFKGYKYISEVPRKFMHDGTKTEWYDSNFESIEGSEALYAMYEYAIRKYNEMYDYLPDYMVEDLQYNYLPEIRKNLAEIFSDKGLKGGMTGWYDKVISELTTNEESGISYAEQDPFTGADLKTLPVRMIHNQLSPEEKSYNLNTITKGFALMAVSYKHKATIEDPIRILEQLVNNSKEMMLNPDKTPLIDSLTGKPRIKEGLEKYKAQYAYAIDAMLYGNSKIEEGVSKKKLLNSDEKIIKENLEKRLEEADTPEGKAAIQADIDALGSYSVASKWWEKVLAFAQLKGMGWNVFAPITNVGFAYISNTTHAAGGEDFNLEHMHKAYGNMLHSVGKSLTLDTLESKQAKKIASLMEKFSVVTLDLLEQKTSNMALKGLKKFNPYEGTKRAEYLNQGATFLALMYATPVTNLKGEIKNLFEAYDTEGNWKTEEFGPQEKEWNEGTKLKHSPANNFYKFKNKLEQVKKIIHGNYDPTSAVEIKKNVLGRAVMMFRSWVAEGFAARFEAEKNDILLGRKRKGRFITLKEQGLVQGPLLILSQMANFLTFGGAFKTSLDELSDVDKANMRKNAAGIMLYISIYVLALMLKSIDSDDDDEKKALNGLINVAFRVQTDMAFFTSPLAFEKITQSSIPAMTIVTDAAKFCEAAQKSIAGDPYYIKGDYKGQSRIKIALGKNLPFFTQVERTISGLSKVNE